MVGKLKARLTNAIVRTHLLSSREAYQRWAATYPPHAHNPFMALEEQTMQALMPALHGKQVLDLACGTGRWGNYARQQGAKQVYSLDDSFAMLQTGQPNLPCAATMTQTPLASSTIEVILCGLAIGHTPHLEAVLAEMSRVLVMGGVALISDVHPFRAWQGAQRTFEADGKTFAVEHHIHRYEAYHTAAQKAGLKIEAVREAGASEQVPPALLVLLLSRFA